MNNKIWVYKETDNSIVGNLIDRYGLSRLCASVLQNRMEVVGGNADNLFKRVLHNLHNPFLLNDMDKAVTRIELAVMRGEKITVFGDYDADGVTSTSILYMFLRENGADVDYYIPNRFSDGYGMNRDAIDLVSENGTKLIITVDNGIAAADEIRYASGLGIDVVVTDHHECPETLPECCAVINPKRSDSTYPCPNLAGAGVAFKLVTALNKGSLESIIKKYILLAAIGTVADVVPLSDENRAIVTMGLKMVPCSKNIGVNALMKVSSVSSPASVSDFAFGVAPRINAAGRLDDASVCVRLFSSNDAVECNKIAENLSRLNSKRQDVEKQITSEAFELIDSEKLFNDKVIVVYKPGWNHGVIGIVASKICEKYYRPCIVLTDDGGSVKGSGRSVSGFDLYESLCACKDALLKFGGHSMAAGLSLNTDNVVSFRRMINEYAENLVGKEGFMQKIYIDADLTGFEIDIPLIQSLEILEPYGMGNPKPVFSLTDVKVISKTSLSDGKHLKLTVMSADTSVEAIGFSMGEYFGLISDGDTVDIAGCLDINSYRGIKKPQIILKDIRRIRH